jgi:unsaturated rhamnogalacturonyl hydrolase
MRRNPIVFEKWDYTAGLMLLAMERTGASTRDPKYSAYVKPASILVRPDGRIATYSRSTTSIRSTRAGRCLLSDQTHDARYEKAADALRQQLRTHPRTAEGGFWHKQIYPQQMWLDGLYMAEPFYAEYAKRHGDTTAMNDVARQFLLIARHLRDPKTGLYYHAWDSVRQQPWADSATGLSKNFWGRAVGWYLMAALDVLDYLPKTHRDRAEIIRVVQQLSDAVARVQDPVSGVWWQVLDQPNRAKNYLEASGSSMLHSAKALARHSCAANAPSARLTE